MFGKITQDEGMCRGVDLLWKKHRTRKNSRKKKKTT